MSGDLLEFTRDPFGGALVSAEAVGAASPSDFASLLHLTLRHWRAPPGCGGPTPAVRGAWVTLDASADHAPHLAALLSADAGFRIHHATPERIVCLAWLPDLPGYHSALDSGGHREIGDGSAGDDGSGQEAKDSTKDSTLCSSSSSTASGDGGKTGAGSGDPCVVPPFCHTYAGCGAVCLDARGRVLAIREKWGAWTQWKLPGGHVDIGERIEVAACRELLEETGVAGRSAAVVCFRAQHMFVFGQDDIYFGCLITPEKEPTLGDDPERPGWSLPIDLTGNHEIAEARWIPLPDFATLPAMRKNHVARLTAREAVRAAADGQGIVAEPIPSHRPGSNPVLYARQRFEVPQSLAWAGGFDLSVFDLKDK